MIELAYPDARWRVELWPDGYHPFVDAPCLVCGTMFTCSSYGNHRGFGKTDQPAIRVCGNGNCYILCSEGCAGTFLERYRDTPPPYEALYWQQLYQASFIMSNGAV